MDNLDTFPGIDECIFCYGPVRPARRREVEEHLSTVSAELREALEEMDGTWYVCPRCGPKTAVKWQSIAWE
jgi:uncharacterized protein with PIN domain